LKKLVEDYDDEFEFDEEDNLGSSSFSSKFASSEEAHEKELSSENGKSDEVNILLGTRRPSSSIARGPQLVVPSVFSIHITSSTLSTPAANAPKMSTEGQETNDAREKDTTSESSGWSLVDDTPSSSSSSTKSEETIPLPVNGWDNPV
jgi:hypothetical protein